ncbi:8-methylmenaquinol:fumarate reductase membrane anchor subunit [Moorella humiferrea]|uniref:CoB--CoM heterodisulfide reductase iron-sulfur subunit B family protein n=1 Tax=Neomoorella humiferrea TaxID=676965 RepID=UPI0030CCCA38
MSETIILYPGCLVSYRFPEYEAAAKLLLQHLGYHVTSLPHALCCGSFLEGSTPNWINYTAYNLALAAKMQSPLVTLCGGCTNAFKRVQHMLLAEPQLLGLVNTRLARLNLKLEPVVPVQHLIQILLARHRDLEEMVTRFLPFKVAPVYPCQVFRPGNIMNFDHPLRPNSLAQLITLTGATAQNYSQEYQCCGSSLYMINPEIAFTMGKMKIESMIASGADLAITACGNCHLLLQRLQSMYHHGIPFPVIFLPQLIGLALGWSPGRMGIANPQLRRLLTNVI